MRHYDDKTCNVPLSMLDDSLDKRITDVYATPKLHQIKIEKDGKRVKHVQVLTYKELFYTDDKSNQRIYIQGEPGRGKSTFAVKLVHDWCKQNQTASAAPIENAAFGDLLTIHKFKLLFFITLRNSREKTDVAEMIKEQLINEMFLEAKRADVYTLLDKIIETEICLVVREGLDEWVSPGSKDLPEPSMAGFPKETCTVLTTSRPWKLVDERIKNSQIDSLIEIEGISDAYLFSETILRCIIDQRKNLEETVNKFNDFAERRKLKSLSSSPMLYVLVIYIWEHTIDEREHLKSWSLCSLYTAMLESLCKKAHSAPGYFNRPPVQCFSNPSYLQPNIEHLDNVAEVACQLLFSSERESSIVFDDNTLSNHPKTFADCKMFALRAGIFTNRKNKCWKGSSISFIHKTVQEFLAAYHIACNPNVIDDIISRYLNCYNNSYLEISQVFIFLCGMNISAANKLSALMNQCDIDHCNYDPCYSKEFRPCAFQKIIESGISEALANKQDGICLELSHVCIETEQMTEHNKTHLNLMLSNVQSLSVCTSSSYWMHNKVFARDKPTSPAVEVNLSSCHKLKLLKLKGENIWLRGKLVTFTIYHKCI
ncbi:hypothetical protein DPMN_140147 [Dreissena polymorpha]|uniref:NACHT domain-containing protein n=1 Tax=Dreissena polymorpha TaxID=45954 RepID=A0A9D4JLH2_DREPO|nr:hypothetical protein DPMN_140147 [Dreissena polymorpha]